MAHTVMKLASTGTITVTSPEAESHDWLSWQTASFRVFITSGPSFFALAMPGLIVTLSTVKVVPGHSPGTWASRRGHQSRCVHGVQRFVLAQVGWGCPSLGYIDNRTYDTGVIVSSRCSFMPMPIPTY